jgi:hypothetical protein
LGSALTKLSVNATLLVFLIIKNADVLPNLETVVGKSLSGIISKVWAKEILDTKNKTTIIRISFHHLLIFILDFFCVNSIYTIPLLEFSKR